jgi:hypothetical protein
MKKVCFTAVDDKRYYPTGTHIMVNSFRRFHPDIDLVVFRQDTADKIMRDGVTWYNAKPNFAERLFDYDLIANMDADHVITGRMTEVFDNVDYDVAAPMNFNDYENTSVENVTEEMFLQGGLIASTNKDFWMKWMERNVDAMKYKCRENDIMNLVIYNDMPQLKLKVLDKEKDYYGCKSLNRESEFYLQEGKLMCRKEQVLCYHWAKGGQFPKLVWDRLPFTDEVRIWLESLNYGQSYKITSI